MTGMHEIGKNYLIQMIGKIMSIFLGLATIGILTRTLDSGVEKTIYGEYITITTFLSFFGVLVDFGLTLTLTQMISSKQGKDEEHLIGNILGLRLVSGAIFYTLAPLTALFFPYATNAKIGIAIGALAYLFLSTAGMLVGVFQKHLLMWRFALAELINRFVYLAFVVLLAVCGFGLVPMIGAMTIANFIWLIVTLRFAKKTVAIHPRFEWGVWMHALKQSWPIALSILFNLIYLRGDVLILSAFRTSAEIAQYGVAYKVVDVLTAFPVMFMGLLLPKLAGAWGEKNTETFHSYLQHAFDFFAVCVFPIAIGAQAVSEPLALFIAGDGYETAGQI